MVDNGEIDPAKSADVLELGRPPLTRRGLLVGLIVAIVAAAVAVPAVVVLTGDSPPPAAAAVPSPTGLASGSPDGPQAQAYLKIGESLKAMTKAMEAGDEAGFVAPAADKKVRAALAGRFRSLRALKPTFFELGIDSGPSSGRTVGGFQEYGYTVALRQCFVVDPCAVDKLVFQTTWRDSAAGWRMVGIATTKPDDYGPQPWEISTLTAYVGSRAMVAAPKAYAAQARAFLPAAERAAKIADKYAFDSKPDRYVVYVAGPAEWRKWFAGGQEDWVIGYAIETTAIRSDIVLRADAIDSGDAEALMKHEMGHVAMRGVSHPSGNAVWWLIEGIAEYVEWDGRGLGAYDGRQNVRRFLREKRFAGDPALVAPTDDPDDWEVNADYGIGFYYTRCIADRFGQDRLLAFTEAVLQDGDVVAPAATNTLGGSWPDITKRCLTYTKRAVGL
jgi:hypothetical protein